MATDWDQRFLKLAQHVGGWSKDPSTQVGAVIVGDRHRVISFGYNGFPPGIADDERLRDRKEKYPRVVHAEANALANAARSVIGYTLYTWPAFTCTACAALMLSAGITRVVAPPCPEDLWLRWAEDLNRATDLWREAGAEVLILE